MKNQTLESDVLLEDRIPSDRIKAPLTKLDKIARVAPQSIYYRWSYLLNAAKLIDLAAILLAGLLSHYLRFGGIHSPVHSTALFLSLSSFITVVALYLANCYQAQVVSSLSNQLQALLMGEISAVAIILTCGYLSHTISDYSRIWLVLWGIIGTSLLIGNRLAMTFFVHRAVAKGQLVERVILVGANALAERMILTLLSNGVGRVQVLGLFEDRRNRPLPQLWGVNILGDFEDLLEYVRLNRIDRVVVTLPWLSSGRINEVIKKLRTVPVRIDLVPHSMIWQFPAINMERLAGVPVLAIANNRVARQLGFLKRIEDLVISGILLLFVSPLLILITLAIKLDSRGPVFFKQKRHGFNNSIFDVYKFRTMKPSEPMQTEFKQAKRCDPRVTRVGRFLRRSSLDELPQLFNVFMGNMSIVGPRPHAVQHNLQFACSISDYFARHNVKPGITGWAQVNGLRGETDTEEKMRHRVEYDLYYIEHWSLLFDLKIILMTAATVWFQKTAY